MKTRYEVWWWSLLGAEWVWYAFAESVKEAKGICAERCKRFPDTKMRIIRVTRRVVR